MDLGLKELGVTLAVGTYAVAALGFLIHFLMRIKLTKVLDISSKGGTRAMLGSTAVVTVLAFMLGLLAETASDWVVSDDNDADFPHPCGLLPPFPDEDRMGKEVLWGPKGLKDLPVEVGKATGIAASLEKSGRLALFGEVVTEKSGYYDDTKKIAKKVYYVAKNTALKEPGYRNVLTRIQLRIDLSRSSAFVSYVLYLVALSTWLLQIVFGRWRWWRLGPAWKWRGLGCAVFFWVFYAAGFYSYEHESREYNKHAFGFLATLEEEDLPKIHRELRDEPEYLKAIEDARDPREDEIKKLLRIVKSVNNGVEWDKEGRVLMVTVVSETKYYEPVGKEYDTKERNVWVTAVPEVRDRMRELLEEMESGGTPQNRLRQLLGLAPTSGIKAFVELWVRPDDLFRPTPNPSIKTTPYPYLMTRTRFLLFPDSVTDKHRDWIADFRSRAYFKAIVPSNTAYPWTQLGYTYDWGHSHKKHHQGVNEFVVRRGRTVIVKKITPIEEYLRDKDD